LPDDEEEEAAAQLQAANMAAALAAAAAAAAALAAQNAPVQVPAAVAAFAYTPALANNLVIDYSTSEGKKLYEAAIKELPIGKFDGKNPHTLLRALDVRAKEQGWRDLLTITIGAVDYYLPRQHGIVTPAQVRAHSDIYMIGAPDRRTQNSLAMSKCLMNSIDTDLTMKVTDNSALYEYAIHNMLLADGPLLLMVILSHCTIQTRSTATNVRRQLTKLDDYMKSDAMKDGNIINFHTYVRNLKSQLVSLSENMSDDDLRIYLFDAYAVAPDPAFVEFMARKNQNIMYMNDVDQTIESIMQIANQFYTDSVTMGKWAKGTSETERLVVLEAHMRSSKSNKPATKGNKKKKGKKGDKKGKDARKNFSYEPSQQWKFVPPTGSEPKAKKVGDAQYYWCPNHQHRDTKAWGMWSRHKLADCKATPPSTTPRSVNSTPPRSASYHALNTIIEQGQDEEDYDYH